MSPLVSISVITYNSSKYILDALNSCASQTYPNIELVISDDASTDNTIELCKSWLSEHSQRFKRSIIVVSPQNRGISANYNQGMDNCTGEWIKEIAGDDMLLPNCIEDYMNFVQCKENSYFCFGRVQVFGASHNACDKMNRILNYEYYNNPREVQLKSLSVYGNWISSASFFYNASRMRMLKIRNDERIPFMEDWPKWINILRTGEKLSFMDKEVAKYRLSETALSTQENLSLRWRQQCALLYIYYQFGPTCRELGIKRAVIRYVRAKQVVHPDSFWTLWGRALL